MKFLYTLAKPTVLLSPTPMCVLDESRVHLITKYASVVLNPSILRFWLDLQRFVYPSHPCSWLTALKTVVIATRAVSIFADALVLILTCIRILGSYRMAKSARLENSISQVLMRKGWFYFRSYRQRFITCSTGITFFLCVVRVESYLWRTGLESSR